MGQQKGAHTGRPLSPHLQIYRWTAHMATSIIHRVTGSALAVGSVILTWWFFSLAQGPDYFSMTQGVLSSWAGRLVLFAMTFAAMQHAASGIRHLIMDTGALLEPKINSLTAKLTYVVSSAATLVIWFAAYKVLGAL